MRTVKELEQALFELAPAYMKEEWDNVGLLCGHEDAAVSRVLVALDPFLPVAREAVEKDAQLLVTHHPLIFFPAKTVNDRDPVGQTILHLMEHGVAAVNMHTNLDSAPGGVNDVLAEALGLTDIGVLAPAGEDEQGQPYGLGRYGTLETECTLPDFLERVKTALHCGGVRYADGGKPVHKVAVGGGACGEFIKTALALGCDTFVTADLKYNQFADARDLGLNLIDAGHYPTENLVCETMARYLETRFPDLEILRSTVHEDVVKFG